MSAFNKVILMGNLTRDPDLRVIPTSNTSVCDFGLAVNRKWKDAQGQQREEVTFVDCTAFGKTAETINRYVQKGRPLFVEGRLKLDTWEDNQGGGKRSRLSVVVENFQFIGGRGGEDDEAASAPAQSKSTARATVPPEDEAAPW